LCHWLGQGVLLLLLGLFGLVGALVGLLWTALAWGARLTGLTVLRRKLLTAPIFNIFTRVLPPVSDTERAALEAGSVWWDGELFSGKPDFSKLDELPEACLTEEEQAFLEGPCEELCAMLDEWKITHE